MRVAAVDASVVGKWLLPGEGESPGAVRLGEDLRTRRITLVAPPVLEHEMTSFIWKAVRDGRLSSEESVEVLLRARNLGIIFASSSRSSLDTLSLANSLRQTAYDCSYLALALELGCDLFTADRRFASAVSAMFPSVKHIEDYPGD